MDKVIDEEYFKNQQLVELAANNTADEAEKVNRILQEKKMARFAELQKQEVVELKKECEELKRQTTIHNQ
jgi:hypothetical protein